MKSKELMQLLTGIMLFGALGACSDDTQPTEDKDEDQEKTVVEMNKREEINLSAPTKSTANGLKDFYLNFTNDAITYVESKKDPKSNNVIVSPLSAAFLLGMSANGYDDTEASKIAQYLSCENMTEMNNLAAVLMEKLPNADNMTIFSLNNSVWVNDRHSLSSNFAADVTQSYKADILYEDFDNPATVLNKINQWGSEKTEGMIPKCLDDLSSTSSAVLVNALLLKSKWSEENKFPVKNTFKGTFNGLHGNETVDMMRSSVKIDGVIGFNDKFTATWINLGNMQYNILLVLPKEKTATHIPLTSQDWAELTSRSYHCNLTIELPKFKMENNLSLNDILKIGGMNVYDTPSIMTMFSSPLSAVIKATQSAAFEIDEEGVKAAAVSEGDVNLTAPPMPSEDYELRFNRPFYFFITEFSTQACILSGYIADL